MIPAAAHGAGAGMAYTDGNKEDPVRGWKEEEEGYVRKDDGTADTFRVAYTCHGHGHDYMDCVLFELLVSCHSKRGGCSCTHWYEAGNTSLYHVVAVSTSPLNEGALI